MRFDLADLSLFRHVVEAGSITRGAERANLALAAASTRVRNMEDALGAPLLVRSRQGVKPIYVTQGHRVSLDTAVKLVRQCLDGFRIPKPTREADHYVRELRRKKMGSG